MLDCGNAIAQGAIDGAIGAVNDIATHPMQAAICAVAGEYVLAYQLSKILYDIAGIGIMALSNTDHAAQQWREYSAPLNDLIDALWNRKISLRDGIKGATQCVIHWKIQDKLLKGLGTICSTVKTKAIQFAKGNPSATPQQYIATPDGTIFKALSNPTHNGGLRKVSGQKGNQKFFKKNSAEVRVTGDMIGNWAHFKKLDRFKQNTKPFKRAKGAFEITGTLTELPANARYVSPDKMHRGEVEVWSGPKKHLGAWSIDAFTQTLKQVKGPSATPRSLI